VSQPTNPPTRGGLDLVEKVVAHQKVSQVELALF